MIDVTQDQSQYLTHFERIEKTVGRNGPAWLVPIRKAAISRFVEMGFPTVKDEEWRYTNVAPIANTAFEPARDTKPDVSRKALAPFLFDGCCATLVVVNGRFCAELSSAGNLPKGVRVASIEAALKTDDVALEPYLARHADYHHQPFAALNTALIEDGAFVFVPRGIVLEEPIHVLYVTVGSDQRLVAHPRTLIVAEESSQVTVVESYAGLGDGAYFTNAVTELVSGENATLDHVKVERENAEAFHIGTFHVHTDRNSTIHSHVVSLGGALVRNEINALLDGEGGHCALNGLYQIGGTQHVDNHLHVEHAKPRCDSREFFKGVLDGSARGIFSGRIYVEKDAQKTDAKQTNMSLLLSEEAQVESKPQLEIFADDVKCTHGATIGQIDEDAVFYLRARGLSETAARSLLVFTFANESLERIAVPALRRQLEQLILRRLPQGQLLQEWT
jgi:Fe-S cluster assembly protein SufD